MKRFLAGSASVIAVVTAASVHAQSPSRAGPPPAAQAADAPAAVAAGAAGLSEVIVTAQRREENLQRAAVAVSVARGADLIASGITEPYRLAELAPGLTIEPTGAGNLIFIRGVGNITTTPNSDPGTAFNYDGVYIGRPSSTNGLFFDLDRVEVLKGPQGTLYGRNATGGAINVVPTQPKLGSFSGYATGTYGDYNTGTAEGAINAPLGQDAAIRLSGSIAGHDGYLRDGTYDNDTKSVRAQLKWKPASNLTVRIAGDYSHLGGASFAAGYLGTYTSTAAGNTFVPSGLSLDQGALSPASQAYLGTINAGTAKRPYAPISTYPHHDDQFYGVNAQVDWKTAIGTFTLIPAWRRSDLNSAGASGFVYRVAETDEQYSVEGRLTGNRISIFDYILGGYFYDESINSAITVNVESAASFPGPNQYHTQSFAGFGRVTAHLSDRFRLVGGLRYTTDSKTFVGTASSFQIVCVASSCPNVPFLPPVTYFTQYPFPIPAGRGVVPYAPGALLARGAIQNYNSSLDNNRLTYHAGAEFDLAPQSLLYATVESGYRAGGFNPAIGFETYAPEYITAYTAGSKNRFLDNRLQLNLEAFYWNYNNQQISHVGVDLSGRAANFTQNVGRSRMYGVEVEGRALLAPNTLVSADVQYLNARYNSFTYPQLYTGTAPLNGCTNAISGTQIVVNCSGQTPPNAPKFTVDLGAQQTIPLGAFHIVAGGDAQYESDRYVGFDYLQQERTGSTWIGNAQVLFGPTDDRWSIAAFVRNIGDTRVLLNATIVPTTTLLTGGTSAPRTYGVRASVKF